MKRGHPSIWHLELNSNAVSSLGFAVCVERVNKTRIGYERVSNFIGNDFDDNEVPNSNSLFRKMGAHYLNNI